MEFKKGISNKKIEKSVHTVQEVELSTSRRLRSKPRTRNYHFYGPRTMDESGKL
jgi:hypothetical protein